MPGAPERVTENVVHESAIARNLLILLCFYCLVPRRGLEPPRIAPLVPETSASTSSATWAGGRLARRRNLRTKGELVNRRAGMHRPGELCGRRTGTQRGAQGGGGNRCLPSRFAPSCLRCLALAAQDRQNGVRRRHRLERSNCAMGSHTEGDAHRD